ncbi:adenosylmethionine--8-amino-7-oxononanoate transaminase [Thiospirillum jenense]|uniref:Adenosylmethionine-8-amino-7-oxononanoate aminotransferase n=1 Tax=Thiospirillum jenense TaxID=1653858 RepID=A0A839HH57_9GAMM|nr:adenosylmethionine--8-amino-7-oxononanoate transaminase [Thiospirillum jenense]MBB1126199.1 adenosylmethionine--8-amino-7-oxononanoate transaminase [Thiospirillum jenense]
MTLTPNPDAPFFNWAQLLATDAAHVWHPYNTAPARDMVYPVCAAQGCLLELSEGRFLIDGMASWWCVIHGYNHPVLNAALTSQLNCVAHVMFAGLTHAPAIQLVERLVKLTPAPLQRVFLCDSGSIAVEVALKIALQYWQALNEPQRTHFLSFQQGYHGDTYHAMSVCDPITGMHRLFTDSLPQQFFASAPTPNFGQSCTDADVHELTQLLEQHHQQLAGVIIEPIVQGAGGMRFYSAEYLIRLRQLCDHFNVLLIADEIATGFGRTGRLFACEHAGISPDILTLGKALTGGYLTLAATLTTDVIAATLSAHAPLLHGPTFMANPLACAVANASIDLLLASDWQTTIQRIENGLRCGLAPARTLPNVIDVRVLGAIGVIEMNAPVVLANFQRQCVERGIWVRPFGRLVYLMPPYIIDDAQLTYLCQMLIEILSQNK